MKTSPVKTPEDLARVHRALKKKFQDKKLIFGVGSIPAKVAFVCEMPGPDEERDARPLSGQNEKFLSQLLKSVGLNKKNVYITNVVKYFPNGKMPTAKEIKSHATFLKEELKTVNPQIVVTLGNIALNGIGLRQPLDNVHGRIFNFGSYELIPTFHPSSVAKNPQLRGKIEADLAQLKEKLKKTTVN